VVRSNAASPADVSVEVVVDIRLAPFRVFQAAVMK
jgi:hypothetical protein